MAEEKQLDPRTLELPVTNGFRAAVSFDLFTSESPGRDFVVFFVWNILCTFVSQPITALSSRKIIHQPIWG